MRQEKQFLLDEIQEQVQKGQAFFIIRHAFSANAANEFRRKIASLGGSYEVVRKRVFGKALQNLGIDLDVSSLEGHLGFVVAAAEPIETLKAAFEYSPDKGVQVVGGQFEGQMYGAEEMEMLSKLPNKDQMRAELLSVLEAPMAQTLGVMDAVLTSVVYCLDNKCKQQEDNNV